MAVTRKQRDQSEEEGGENRDPALTVKSQYHRSQPQPPTENNTPVPRLARARHHVPPSGPQATALLVEQRSQGHLAASGRHGTLWLPPLPLGHQLGQQRQSRGLISRVQGSLQRIQLRPQRFWR